MSRRHAGAARLVRRPSLLLLLLFSAAAVISACGDDDGDAEAAAQQAREVEEVTRGLFGASPDTADYFFEHVTDNLLETAFFTTREDCRAAVADCVGEPSVVESVTDIEVDAATATAFVASDFGRFKLGLVREDGVWKGNSLEAGSDPVPDGTTRVELGLSEFNFIFDEADIPAGGDFAFAVTNHGTQAHEVVIVGIPPGEDPESAVVAVTEEAEPPVALKVYIQPGQEIDMALDEPLKPGDYALVCFFPDTEDPEFTSHIDKGMVAQFTVQ